MFSEEGVKHPDWKTLLKLACSSMLTAALITTITTASSDRNMARELKHTVYKEMYVKYPL